MDRINNATEIYLWQSKAKERRKQGRKLGRKKERKISQASCFVVVCIDQIPKETLNIVI